MPPSSKRPHGSWDLQVTEDSEKVSSYYLIEEQESQMKNLVSKAMGK
jgi:hypothetical protein